MCNSDLEKSVRYLHWLVHWWDSEQLAPENGSLHIPAAELWLTSLQKRLGCWWRQTMGRVGAGNCWRIDFKGIGPTLFQVGWNCIIHPAFSTYLKTRLMVCIDSMNNVKQSKYGIFRPFLLGWDSCSNCNSFWILFLVTVLLRSQNWFHIRRQMWMCGRLRLS